MSLFQYCLNLSGSFKTAEKVLFVQVSYEAMKYILLFTRRICSFREGNVFSHACLSVCSQGGGGLDFMW